MPREGKRPGLRVTAREGSPVLYVRGTIRGRRVFESTGTDKPELAEEYRATREAELYRAAVYRQPGTTTWAAAVVSYANTAPHRPSTLERLNKLTRYFGARTRCDEIDQERVDRAAQAILRSGFLPATKQREIVGPVKAVLTYAARRRWCPPPMFEGSGRSGSRTDWLTPGQAENLVDAAAEHLRPLVVFLISTGARLSEALELDWRDVDLVHARVTLRDTKTRRQGSYGRDRIVSIAPRAVAELAQLDGDRLGAVFRTNKGKPYRDKGRASGGQIKTAWAGACRRAGLPGAWKVWISKSDVQRRVWEPEITPHHARHTWASWHYAMHRDLLLLRTDGGWSSVQLVERYAHVAPATMAPQIRVWLRIGANLVHPLHQARA